MTPIVVSYNEVIDMLKEALKNKYIDKIYRRTPEFDELCKF
jgi:hypothetical protein